MRGLAFLKIIGLVFGLSASIAWADPNPVEEAAEKSTEEAIALSLPMALPVTQIEYTWEEILAAHEASDLKEINKLVIELDRLKVIADVRSLDPYASIFLEWAKQSYRAGSKSEASFYTRKALQLSPDSPMVLARALPLVQKTSSVSIFEYLMKIFHGTSRSPDIALHMIKIVLYPLLVALSIGLLCTFALFFACKIEVLLRGAGKIVSPTLRGIFSPFILGVLLIAPLLAGPLWAAFMWSILLYVLIPQQRWLGFAVGTLLVCWGTIIPVRESLRSWLENPGVQAMLDVSAGSYHHGAAEQLRALASQRPEDGALHYTLGQTLRRHGEYDAADEAFVRAELLLGKQGWTKAQRGLIAFLSKKPEVAQTLFNQAEELGLHDAAFYFNFSKIKFELLDTAASRHYLAKSIALDPELTKTLEQREQLLGDQSALAVAEIQLPFSRVLVSALTPTMSIHEACNTLSDTLMYGTVPPFMCVAGAILIFGFFFARKRRSRTVPLSSYVNLWPARVLEKMLSFVPGGAWINTERPLIGMAILSCCTFLCMPLLAWPSETNAVFAVFPELAPYFLCFVAFFALTACYLGAQAEK